MLGMYALYKAQCGPGLGNPIYNGLHAFCQSAHFWAQGGGAIFLKVSRADIAIFSYIDNDDDDDDLTWPGAQGQ